MNSQQKKLIALAAVVMLHAVVITLMLAQHGCKSDGQKSSPPDAVAAPAPAAMPAPAPAPVAVDNNFTPPTRPAPEVMAQPLPLTQFEPSPTDVAPPSNLSTTPSAPTVTWTVVSGDNPSSIAKKNGITTKELFAANAPKVTAATKLKIGQVLVIPNHAAAAPSATQADAAAPTDASVYTVVAGDSLSKIASKNGTTVPALKSLNKLSTETVRIGQKLKLPAGGAASGATAPVSTTAPVTTAGESDAEYTIVSGDSLSKIASKTGTKTAELMTLNGLTEATARNLHPGQKLKLPTGAHAAATAAMAPTPAFVAPTYTAPVPGAPPPTPMQVMSVPDSNTTTPAPITHVN